MTPARAVGAGGAPDARTSRGGELAPADGPVWRARLTDGFAGRVVDDLDRPLAGALVVAVAHCSAVAAGVTDAGVGAAGVAGDAGSGSARTGSWFVVSTEADGRFTIPVLPRGRYTLFALHIGPPPATSELMLVDGGFLSVPLRLVISRGALVL
jgi:hypothetical protein